MTKFIKRKFLLFAFVSAFFIPVTQAQVFSVDTVLYNGSSSKLINLVFMGDGFQGSEMNSYIDNVRTVSNYLLNTSPFAEYKNYFNVFAISVPSSQSGANHPGTASDESSSGGQPALTVNTYFNSTFDYSSIHRLLVPRNYTALNNVLFTNFPFYDQALILVNSPYYGGSGGAYATSSLNTSSFEVMVHETGHSFAGLADEYFAGDNYFGEKPNMTQQTNPLLVKWKNWIGTNNIGIYPYCCSSISATWYKPHQNCKMQYLNVPFCSVCKETIIERIHTLIGNVITGNTPATTSAVNICSVPVKFSLSLIKPVTNTLKVKWLLNGNVIANNTDDVTINKAQLANGSNTLSAEVMDTTLLSRSDNHAGTHTYSVSWNITNNAPVNLVGADTTAIVICANDKTDISNLYNTTGLTVQWDIANPSSAGAGTYHLYATNSNGCTDTAAVTVQQQLLTWKGTVDNNWHNLQNWLPQIVPTDKTHVLIKGGTPFPCVISAAAATAASVQVKDGGTYSVINNQKITITSKCTSLPVQ